MQSKLRLSAKITLGLAASAVLCLSAGIFCVGRFNALEGEMRRMNELYVPALKTLNQIEGHVYLLDFELDRALQNAKEPIKWAQLDAVASKVQTLRQLYASGGAESLAELVNSLEASAQRLRQALAALEPSEARTAQAAALSDLRGDLRHQVRISIRDVDREIRMAALQVQQEISRSGIIVTVLLVFSLVTLATLLFWIKRSLLPLQQLTRTVQEISARGLGDENIRWPDPRSDDEIGFFAREFRAMGLSLRDRNKQLEIQRKNLESAHGEMARQNADLRQARSRIAHQERLALVGRLSAQMAHEIRNPLNAMGLHIDFLESRARKEARSGETLEALASVRNEIERLSAITDSYLRGSRGIELEVEESDVNEIVREVVAVYGPLLKDSGIVMQLDLAPLKPLPADRRQLSQVIGNLVKNAAEAFEPGKEQPDGLRSIRLSTRLDLEKRVVELECVDTGRGIREEEAREIFSPFYTTKADGTGLGLAHSRQVVEAHGGQIFFHSRFGKGTSFRISLPVGEGNAHARA